MEGRSVFIAEIECLILGITMMQCHAAEMKEQCMDSSFHVCIHTYVAPAMVFPATSINIGTNFLQRLKRSAVFLYNAWLTIV